MLLAAGYLIGDLEVNLLNMIIFDDLYRHALIPEETDHPPVLWVC